MYRRLLSRTRGSDQSTGRKPGDILAVRIRAPGASPVTPCRLDQSTGRQPGETSPPPGFAAAARVRGLAPAARTHSYHEQRWFPRAGRECRALAPPVFVRRLLPAQVIERSRYPNRRFRPSSGSDTPYEHGLAILPPASGPSRNARKCLYQKGLRSVSWAFGSVTDFLGIVLTCPRRLRYPRESWRRGSGSDTSSFPTHLGSVGGTVRVDCFVRLGGFGFRRFRSPTPDYVPQRRAWQSSGVLPVNGSARFSVPESEA
jgi:hypothetical protein